MKATDMSVVRPALQENIAAFPVALNSTRLSRDADVIANRGVSTAAGQHFYDVHNNVKNLEFSTLLPDIVTIADEVDVQLREQMKHFKAAEVAEKAKGKGK